jgi:hypothetical protein
MSREPNLGIYRICPLCHKWFWCDDGSPICSDEEWEIEDEET